MTAVEEKKESTPIPATPSAALRTYRFLRVSVVGVIAMLLLSLALESYRTDWCLKGSISAYYYSPARLVFIGSLCAIGLVLIALWGMTALEDSLFNLAGLLAPVVAFIPAKNDGLCFTDTPAKFPLSPEQQEELAAAGKAATYDAIANNMRTYLAVVGIVLAVLAILGLVARRRPKKFPVITASPLAYWLPLILALILWGLGAWQFYLRNRTPGGASWFYQNVHFTSAIVMFVFITLGIFWIGVTWLCGKDRYTKKGRNRFMTWCTTALDASLGNSDFSPEKDPHRAFVYIGQSVAMLAVSGALFALDWKDKGPAWFLDHAVFWIELWMILNVAAFWALQTKERWTEGAPPRTDAERMAAKLKEEAVSAGQA